MPFGPFNGWGKGCDRRRGNTTSWPWHPCDYRVTILRRSVHSSMPTPRQQRMLTGFEAEIPEGHCSGGAPPRQPECSVGQTVYVMDTHYLIFQVFHALPDIRSPAGHPVAAVHGFIQDVLGLVKRKQPDYLFCAFDSALTETFRRKRYPAYKANREEMPEDLRLQLRLTHRILEAMKVPMLQCPGYEADDILATVAREAERLGVCVTW